MHAVTVVAEGSSHFVAVTFEDEDGAPLVPDTVTVRIDDEASGQAVRAPAAVSPAASIEIEITPAENAMVDPTRSREWRTVTVTAVYGGSRQVVGQYRYVVRNLRFV